MNKFLMYVFKGAMILALLCIIMLFVVSSGSAEQIVLILSAAINGIVVLVSGIAIHRGNSDK